MNVSSSFFISFCRIWFPVFPFYLKMNKLSSGEGKLIWSILFQLSALPNHNDHIFLYPEKLLTQADLVTSPWMWSLKNYMVTVFRWWLQGTAANMIRLVVNIFLVLVCCQECSSAEKRMISAPVWVQSQSNVMFTVSICSSILLPKQIYLCSSILRKWCITITCSFCGGIRIVQSSIFWALLFCSVALTVWMEIATLD